MKERENIMAKATKKPRPWSKEDVRMLKTLVREKTKTSVVARKLKRTEAATRQKASVLGVKLVGAIQRKRKARPSAQRRPGKAGKGGAGSPPWTGKGEGLS
jgi:hypothetical protein